MIQNGGTRNWPDILNDNLDIDDIYADSLISYFAPLEDFIEASEESFEYKSGSKEDKELEELEKHILQEINAPTTTPPPSPPPTVAITGRQITTKTTLRNNVHQAQQVEMLPKLTTSVSTRDDKPKSSVSSGSEVPVNESLTPGITNDTQDNTPKISTSKTIWVVSVVLIAIIVICMIAIFGKQRCRKTPKNRRYV